MQQLKEYMTGLLDASLCRERLQLLSVSREYLIEMLVGFAITETLFGNDGSLVLVDLYQQAVETQGSQRTVAFRRLGDTALFISGFFNGYVERSTTGIGYYIGMGASAYRNASLLSSSMVLAELSMKFSSLVEVLINMSGLTTLGSSCSIDSLLERYAMNPTSQLLIDRLVHEKAVPVFSAMI